MKAENTNEERKMKRLLRISVLLLAVVMMLGLVGCDSRNKKNSVGLPT